MAGLSAQELGEIAHGAYEWGPEATAAIFRLLDHIRSLNEENAALEGTVADLQRTMTELSTRP